MYLTIRKQTDKVGRYVVLTTLILLLSGNAFAGFFEGDPKTQAEEDFFRMAAPCCGEGDAFQADDFVVENGKTYAIITNGDDLYMGVKDVLPVGLRVEITPEMMAYSQKLGKNMTGHGIVFMHVVRNYSTQGKMVGMRNGNYVDDIKDAEPLCYFPPNGS
jgi:hypothetical protein